MSPDPTNLAARSKSTWASASSALLLSRAATRARSRATWLSTSSMACCSFQRWLLASASMPRTLAVAARRSACAISTAALFTATAVSKGSLSSSTRSSPLCTRLSSSTSTRETWPATRGATKVTWPLTNASSVETVLRVMPNQGTPNQRAGARTRTPTVPISSRRRRDRPRSGGALAGCRASRSPDTL